MHNDINNHYIKFLVGILVTGASSGAHMNPAVSVAMAVWGRLPPFNFMDDPVSIF